MSAGNELEAFVMRARAIAIEAGALQLASLGQVAPEFKGLRELVTELDRASEELICTQLLGSFPDHDIYAEESHRRDDRRSPYRWIIDPLDGTTNYTHGLPIFAVSLGLERRSPDGSSEIVGAVIHTPAIGETFHAWKGGGAWLGERRLSVSPAQRLIDAVLATGFSYVIDRTENDNLDNWAKLSLKTRGVRRMGAAAVDLAYVAAGRFAGFWEMHLQPYDVAAGALLVREAGGRVTDMKGGDDWLFGRQIIATNGLLHEALQESLAPVIDDGTF